MDSAEYIGLQVKAIMTVIDEIDPYQPDEDLVEVLIGQVQAWGTLEVQLLFPALEAAFEGTETATEAGRQRLNTLYSLQENMHLDTGAEAPFTDLARKYIDAVKYHLVVDVQELVPLAAQLDPTFSVGLASRMAAMRRELE